MLSKLRMENLFFLSVNGAIEWRAARPKTWPNTKQRNLVDK